jgi:hypothetical protein
MRFFYDVHVNRVEQVQRKFIKFALRGLASIELHDLPLYENRCALFHIDYDDFWNQAIRPHLIRHYLLFYLFIIYPSLL